MTTLNNLESLTFKGVKITDIPLNYNPYVEKDEALVNQKVMEQYIDTNNAIHYFDFNKKHETNVIYDTIVTREFEDDDFAYDTTYNMKFKKLTDSTFEIPTTFSSKINQSTIYLTDNITTLSRKKYTLNTKNYINNFNYTFGKLGTKLGFTFNTTVGKIYKLCRGSTRNTTFFYNSSAGELVFALADIQKFFHKDEDCMDTLTAADTDVLAASGKGYVIHNNTTDLYFKLTSATDNTMSYVGTKGTSIYLDKYGYDVSTGSQVTKLVYFIEETEDAVPVSIPGNIKKVIVSDKSSAFIIKRDSTEPLEILYPKMKQDHIDDTNKVCTIYVNNSYDRFYSTDSYVCTIKCKNLYLSSYFFKGINLDSAGTKYFGDFNAVNMETLFIEEDGLNTSQTGSDLVTLLRTVLNLNSTVNLALY